MPYAVMQKSSAAPSMEQLKSAFRNVAGLAELDALLQGKNAFGFLAKGFELDLATALKDSLAAQGIEAEVVAEASLPQLPEIFCLSLLHCTPEALLVHDSMGRVATVEWKDILIIAAGSVSVTEFKEVRRPLEPSVERGVKMIYNWRHKLPSHRSNAFDLLSVLAKQFVPPQAELEASHREERKSKLWLEIILAGAATRYRINADPSAISLFQCLGERQTKDLSCNFSLLVQDLIQGAPQAALNHGAYNIRENVNEVLSYPGKLAFYNEIVWLLWKLARDQGTEESPAV